MASLGSALEYFDFAVYGLLSKYLSSIFFSTADGMKSTMYTLFIFALGHIARPIGGTIAGIIGDIYGRRRVFLSLTGIMCISTLAIGLLPSYTTWGIASPILLMFFRLLQGISFGGEISGATTIIGESSSKENRSVNTSFMISGTAVGAVFATGILFTITKYLSTDDIINWAWRIPFLVGGVLGILLWFYRKDISETQEFKKVQKNSLKDITLLFVNNRKSVILSMMICAFTSALIIVNIFYPGFLNGYYGIDISEIYKATTISLIFSCFCSPTVGFLLKYVSKYNLLIGAYITYILLSVLIFSNLENCGFGYLLFFMIINQVFISTCYVCHISIKYDLFPTEVRYTGLAFSANIISAIVSSLPVWLTQLKNTYNNPLSIPFVLMGFCTISLIAVLFCKRYTQKA